MGNNWKARRDFIRDWCSIGITVISLVVFVNMMSFVHSYAATAKKELTNQFEVYCIEEIERSVELYE